MSPPKISASSYARKSAPIKAVPSSLSSRTAPSIPPAAEGYEPLVKGALRHRLTQYMIPYTYAFSWLLTAAGLRLSRVIMPHTLFWAALRWLVGALPVLVMMKTHLTAVPTPATSPYRTLRSAFSKRLTTVAFAAFVISALLLMVLHVLSAYAHEANDPRLGIFVKSKKHPYYLNARFVFLAWSQFIVAAVFWSGHIVLDRFVFRWSPASHPTSHFSSFPFDTSRTLRTLLVLFLIPTVTVPLAGFLLLCARLIILPILFHLPFLPILLRPFVGHFLRGRGTSVAWMRAWRLAVGTCTLWEWTELVFSAFVKQPIILNPSSPLPLISGITTPPPKPKQDPKASETFYHYFAYAELSGLASDDSERARAAREAIFVDQKYQPNMWSVLVREALLRLGKDYRMMLVQDLWVPKDPTKAPQETVVEEPHLHADLFDSHLDDPHQPPPPGSPAPLIRASIFRDTPKTPLRTVIDALAADGAVSRAVDEHIRFPDAGERLFQRVRARGPEMITRGEWLSKLGQWMEGKGGWVWERMQDRIRKFKHWWLGERQDKLAEGYLPNRELDAMIITTLSDLICASLTEDKYGVVQRDIPRVLEAFLSLLEALEEYNHDLREAMERAQANGSVIDMDAERARGVLLVVIQALSEGITKVVRTFGERLMAFKFPVRTAKKLQGFTDYWV